MREDISGIDILVGGTRSVGQKCSRHSGGRGAEGEAPARAARPTAMGCRGEADAAGIRHAAEAPSINAARGTGARGFCCFCRRRQSLAHGRGCASAAGASWRQLCGAGGQHPGKIEVGNVQLLVRHARNQGRHEAGNANGRDARGLEAVGGWAAGGKWRERVSRLAFVSTKLDARHHLEWAAMASRHRKRGAVQQPTCLKRRTSCLLAASAAAPPGSVVVLCLLFPCAASSTATEKASFRKMEALHSSSTSSCTRQQHAGAPQPHKECL